MNDLSWLEVAKWCAIGLFLICLAIVLWCVLRDRQLRGIRITNEEIQRERVTLSLPNFAMRDFKDRP